MNITDCICENCDFAVALNWFRTWQEWCYCRMKLTGMWPHVVGLEVWSRPGGGGRFMCRREYEACLEWFTNLQVDVKGPNDCCSMFAPKGSGIEIAPEPDPSPWADPAAEWAIE